MNLRNIFLVVLLIHLAGLSYKTKQVIELNIQKLPEPIKIQLYQAEGEEEQKEFVDTEKSGINEEVDTKYVSDRTQKVEEETVSNKKHFGKQLKGGETQSEASKKKKLSFKDLALKSGDMPIAVTKESGAAEPSEQPGQGGDSTISGDTDTYPIISENIKESDKTSLNTIQLKYASFYRRMRQQVENSWVPLLQRMDNVRLGPGEHETKILLKISDSGEIIGLKLDKSSGYQELDVIGIKTFKKIRIFHNPPSDIFNGKTYFYLTWSLRLNN